MAKNISTSKVHEIIMAHEFFFASISDLFIFACFPKMAVNITSLVHLFGEMEGKVKMDNLRKVKYLLYSVLTAFMYVGGTVPALFSTTNMMEFGMVCCLLISGSLRQDKLFLEIFLFKLSAFKQ
jgi:hypothetical protein